MKTARITYIVSVEDEAWFGPGELAHGFAEHGRSGYESAYDFAFDIEVAEEAETPAAHQPDDE